jgi:hypothetical protein
MVDFDAWLNNPTVPRIVLVEVSVKSGGSETTRFLSTRPYVTSPTDTPANQYYDPIVIGGIQYTEVLDIAGTGGMSGGDIEVANYNGERDSWLDDVWDNRSVKAWIGDPSWARSDFQLIFNGVVATLTSSSRDTLTLTIRDKLQQLNSPVTDEKIGGTGTNKDNVVSLTFGEAHNVSPQLAPVDPITGNTLTYQIHDGPIEGILEVRDNGQPVSVTVNNAAGTFTLNQASAGEITASVQGDKNPTYVNTISKVIQRLVTGYGNALSRFTSADLDTTNLAQFDTQCSQPIGVYADGNTNLLTLCQDIAASVDARLVMSRAGLMQLIQVSIPGTGTPVAIGPAQILEKSLVIAERPFVKASVMLGFDKNWTVQNNLLTGIPDAHKTMFATEWLTATSTNLQTKADYKLNDAPPQTDTMLKRRTDANTEANRRVALWSVPRTVFQFEGTADLIGSLSLGCAATITHPRFGLANGKTGTIVSLSPDWFKGTITVKILV